MKWFAYTCAILAALSTAIVGLRLAGGEASAFGVFGQGRAAMTHVHQQAAAEHDVGVNYVTLLGPGAVNISDTNGRYMWVSARIQNFSDHLEGVSIGLHISETPPQGCTRTVNLVMPGQSSFQMEPGDEWSVLWRVKYECHSPAIPAVLGQAVTVSITHRDGADTNPANNAVTARKNIIVR
jgi:hypothetical protein